jgi:hypothetical protein
MATGGAAGGSGGSTPTVITGTRSLKMPTFSGGTEKDDLGPLDFVERIETYCRSAKRDPNDECVEMHLALRGGATIWWRTLTRRKIDVTQWTQVRKAFLETYAPTMTGQTAQAVMTMLQKPGETVNDYFGRLDQILDEIVSSFPAAKLVHRNTHDDLRDHIQKFLFIGGLRETLRQEVQKIKTTELHEALKEACQTELIYQKPTTSAKTFAIDDSDDNYDNDMDDDEIAAINQRRLRLGKKPMSKKRFNPNGFNSSEVKCYNCNKMGHIAKNCSAPRRKPIHAIQEEARPEEERMAAPDPHINAIRDTNDLDFW